MHALYRLHLEIDARVHAVRESHPDWLCGKGCDGCCRKLADEPQLTALEWQELRNALGELPPAQLAEIRERVEALRAQSPSPIVCPLLDLSSGSCPIYAQRPVACRTYGFYVQRTKGLYCSDIESCVDSGALADVVWGNHDSVDRELAALGNIRPLSVWFQSWQDEVTEGSGIASSASEPPAGGIKACG